MRGGDSSCWRDHGQRLRRLDDASGVDSYVDLVAELIRRGWSDADLKKLTGQNILRVLRTAEQVSAKQRAVWPASEDLITDLDKK